MATSSAERLLRRRVRARYNRTVSDVGTELANASRTIRSQRWQVCGRCSGEVCHGDLVRLYNDKVYHYASSWDSCWQTLVNDEAMRRAQEWAEAREAAREDESSVS